MRVLKLQNINGDGSSSDKPFPFYPDLDPATNQPYRDDNGEPCVALMLRPVTKERYAEIVKAHTKPIPNGSGQMVEKTDWNAVNQDAACEAIVSWTGFVGADDLPVTCTDRAKRALDTMLRTSVLNHAMYAQPVEVTAASFRQPAVVPGVVLGLGQDQTVLSAREG